MSYCWKRWNNASDVYYVLQYRVESCLERVQSSAARNWINSTETHMRRGSIHYAGSFSGSRASVVSLSELDHLPPRERCWKRPPRMGRGPRMGHTWRVMWHHWRFIRLGTNCVIHLALRYRCRSRLRSPDV